MFLKSNNGTLGKVTASLIPALEHLRVLSSNFFIEWETIAFPAR
jgi:hypothetical protein